MLRDFLSYAAHGGSQSLPEPQAKPGSPSVHELHAKPRSLSAPGGAAGVGDALDPLVSDLASRLRVNGLVVRTGYGTSAQRLDLAIEDPRRRGRVLVAVETDGPRYAAMSSTRDRDRLRIEQLRRLGWEHVRIWSTDLFRDPARDVARVSAAVRLASEAHLLGGQEAGPAPREEPDQKALPDSDPPATRDTSKPEQTRDDTDAGWGERPREDSHDEWLRAQRPPHWG